LLGYRRALPAVDDANERPVAQDTALSERVALFGERGPVLSTARRRRLHTFHHHERFVGGGTDASVSGGAMAQVPKRYSGPRSAKARKSPGRS